MSVLWLTLLSPENKQIPPLYSTAIFSVRNILSIINFESYINLLHPYYNIYALKEPLVYQDGRLDGDEATTKKPLTLQFADKPMPSFLKNTTNFSVITSSKKIK